MHKQKLRNLHSSQTLRRLMQRIARHREACSVDGDTGKANKNLSSNHIGRKSIRDNRRHW
jgi:hypothetical protein